MSEFQATGIMIALFALRCIAPLVITLAIGYLMNRLVDRWQAEDAELMAGQVISPDEPQETGLGIKKPSITIPCWILRNCDERSMADCPAKKQPGLPCWLVRMRHDGKLPAACPDCLIYVQAMAAAT